MTRSLIVCTYFAALFSTSAHSKTDHVIPRALEVSSCSVTSVPASVGAWNPPVTTCSDLLLFLPAAQAVSEGAWLRNYSHVAGADTTGEIVLQSGEHVRWLVRPGGLGRLTFRGGAELFMVRCCAK